MIFGGVVARPEGMRFCHENNGIANSDDPLAGTENCGVPNHLASMTPLVLSQEMGWVGHKVRAMPSARSGVLRTQPLRVFAVPAPATIARRVR